jgi:type I restriction enzyme R subunit
MNEEQLENLCLDWFREGGWDVLHGPDIAPDGSNPKRRDYAQTILENDLRQVFEKINPHLPAQVLENCFEQVLSKIRKPVIVN